MVYTIPQLAIKWQVCELTIRNLIHRGELKSFKTGRVYRIKDEWVKQYEEGNHESMDGDSITN